MRGISAPVLSFIVGEAILMESVASFVVKVSARNGVAKLERHLGLYMTQSDIGERPGEAGVVPDRQALCT